MFKRILTAVLVVTFAHGFVYGQFERDTRELERLEEMLESLISEAEVMEERGQEEHAAELYREAEAVEERLVRTVEELERRRMREDGHQPHDEHERHLVEALERIEVAMENLRAIGDERALHHLEIAAETIRDRIEAHRAEIERDRERKRDREHEREREHRDRDEAANREMEVARRQLEVMRMGVDTLRRARRGEEAEMLHHAVRAREINLEGRRDEEAMHIRAMSPSRAEIAELLGRASRIQVEWGNDDVAHSLAETASAFARRGDRRREHEEERQERDTDDERQAWLEHETEMFRLARKAFEESEHEHAADLAEHVIHANELMLEDDDGRDAREIIESAPGPGERLELMQFASELYAEWDRDETADELSEMAARYQREFRKRREFEERDRRADTKEHVEHLERQIEELHDHLEHLRRELDELRDRNDP